MRAAISSIEAVRASMKSLGALGASAPCRIADRTAGTGALLGASRRSRRCFRERTSVLSDMGDSVFIGDTLNNPNYVDDAFRGAKALAR
jgi:hypothetical protein